MNERTTPPLGKPLSKNGAKRIAAERLSVEADGRVIFAGGVVIERLREGTIDGHVYVKVHFVDSGGYARRMIPEEFAQYVPKRKPGSK